MITVMKLFIESNGLMAEMFSFCQLDQTERLQLNCMKKLFYPKSVQIYTEHDRWCWWRGTLVYLIGLWGYVREKGWEPLMQGM